LIYEHWKQVPRTDNAWPYRFFTPKEIACRGTGGLVVVHGFVDRLDKLRSLFGSPLRLNSAYRSPVHNALVGGAPLSRHKFADAGDLSTVGQDRELIKRLAEKVGFTGYGHYDTFLHVDLGRPRQWGKWA
jgi:uncharacterized protein YcbK (DUF882 family)